MTKTALILFAHGARDPAWAEPFERLRALCGARLSQTAIRLAYLDLTTPDLMKVAAELVEGGVDRATIVPVFLGRGGHVARDLPRLVAEVRARWPTSVCGAFRHSVGSPLGVPAHF